MDKRTFIKSVLIGAAGIFGLGFTAKFKALKTRQKWDGTFRKPELPYSFDALMPFADGKTMEQHYNYYSSFTDKFNAVVVAAGLAGKTAHTLLKEISRYPSVIRVNGGGYMNHKLFFSILAPPSDKKPSAQLLSAMERDFGSFGLFKSGFSDAAKSVSGSGWAWLIIDKSGRLKITTTHDHDHPIMDIADETGIPVLCLDVWDHACSLNDEKGCSAYIDAFWQVVDWDMVSKRYKNSKRLPLG